MTFFFFIVALMSSTDRHTEISTGISAVFDNAFGYDQRIGLVLDFGEQYLSPIIRRLTV
ncbi:MAG: hypothetical protein ACMUEM_06240 [Flavobacteriales bacterium AspAUS03]